jgi:MYXO-CTERM domain-containing protein
MHSSLRPSLGSLAAMVAITMPTTLDAQVVNSTFSNLTFANGSLSIDLDNNGQADFSLFANAGLASLNAFNNGSVHLFPNGIYLSEYTFGSEITAWGDGNSGEFGALSGHTGYVGVVFERSGDLHAGWLQFDFTGTDDGPWTDGILLAGAWEATPEASIAAGATAVPEPAHAAAGLGLLAAVGAWFRRRRASR